MADPAKAGPMQAYMKSELPFYGVQKPARDLALREVFAAHGLETFDEWRGAVLELWRGARYREERYAAIALVRHKTYRRYRTLDALPLYEELIVTGAWWDFVDDVAGLVGELLRAQRDVMSAVMREWSRDDNLWKRRVSIICQVGFKRDTDLELLYDCIGPNLADREFFIRKAIGWALRDYAWTDPAEIARYVAEHEAELSPVSRREATKNLARLLA
jgi:3-methyladenine DNA glycosylase AlkD